VSGDGVLSYPISINWSTSLSGLAHPKVGQPWGSIFSSSRFSQEMKRSKNQRRQKAARSSAVANLRFGPPSIKSNVIVRHTFRFLSTAGMGSPVSVTANNILGACGNVCTVAPTGVTALAGSARVHSLSCWAPVAQQGNAVITSVEWLDAGGANSFASQMETSDISVSVSKPAYFRSKPPKESGAAFWFGSSTNPLFNLVAPFGTIIDLDVSFILNDSGTPGLGIATASGVLGTVGWTALDGPTSHIFAPVSLHQSL